MSIVRLVSLVSLLALLGCIGSFCEYNATTSRGLFSLDAAVSNRLRKQTKPSWAEPTEEFGSSSSTNTSSSRYISPLEEFDIDNITASLPAPLSVIEQYKAWHSQEALERDPHNRTFMVAYYQAPLSVGNYLHYFTSAFYWGILTNRTILWKYMDKQTCLKMYHDFDEPFHKKRCLVAGATQADSDNILTRAPWIASYDEWKDKLNLPMTHHMDRMHTQWFRGSKRIDGRKTLLKIISSEFVDTYYQNKLVVDIHPWAFLRMDYHYWMPDLVDLQLETSYAREAVAKLGAWGSEFLFGLLWRYSFDYAAPIRNSVERHADFIQETLDDSTLTFAMHSRHIHSSDKGCNTTLERNAVKEILQQHSKSNMSAIAIVQGRKPTPCQITLLSDRICTIDRTKEWLEGFLGCKAVTAQHDAVDATFSEHGPFSGAGFFRDMLLAGLTARDGMIGSLETSDGFRWRSSSELIEESIAYYRTMRFFKAGNDPTALRTMYWSTIERGNRIFGRVSDTAR
ncbi:hypothetical protein MPSEU_000951000 [Mayamaea pseudoterrestris]|nr:hypothetical protein MPSEU_000951000 [Mayamaea pseudoterrestris]